MERLLPRIWVFVLAFCMGINITAIWRIYSLPEYSLPAPPQPQIFEETIEPAVTADEGPQLVDDVHNCGASEDGQIYNYNDGGWVWPRCRRFKSSWAAMQEYLNRMKGATLEERSLIRDGNGNQVGEEILLTAPQVVRIRMKGRHLCEVQASSVYHLNWFEKRR